MCAFYSSGHLYEAIHDQGLFNFGVPHQSCGSSTLFLCKHTFFCSSKFTQLLDTGVHTLYLNLVPRAHVSFGQHQDTFLEPTRLLLLNFDTTVLSKPNFDFPSFSSAYWMSLRNASTSTLSLETMKTKARMRRKTGSPEILVSGNWLFQSFRAPCLGADEKARGLWERDWLYLGFT